MHGGVQSIPAFLQKLQKSKCWLKLFVLQQCSLLGCSSMNIPRRDCYFQLSSTQPIEMGESSHILLKAKVSSSEIDPQPRFAEGKLSQSHSGISCWCCSDLSLCCDHAGTFPSSWIHIYKNWQLPISPHSLSELPCITCKNSEIHFPFPEAYPALVCCCRAGFAIRAFWKGKTRI